MIDISTIVKSINKETTIETELTLTSFESRLGDYPILKKQPISLHISNVENAAVHITGTVDIDIAIPCSRCLEEVPTNMHFDIDKTLKITDGALVDEEMEETDYLIGFELDVDKLVYAEILVNWPMRVLFVLFLKLSEPVTHALFFGRSVLFLSRFLSVLNCLLPFCKVLVTIRSPPHK